MGNKKFKYDNRNVLVVGVKVFDPRDSCWKISDNPALLMGDLIAHRELQTSWASPHDTTFWERIGKMADICDKEWVDCKSSHKNTQDLYLH